MSTELRPFDAKEALERSQAGEWPVILEGWLKPYRVIAVDGDVVWVLERETQMRYTFEIKYMKLTPLPKNKREVWVAVSVSKSGEHTARSFDSKEDAEEWANEGDGWKLAAPAAKIEWEE